MSRPPLSSDPEVAKYLAIVKSEDALFHPLEPDTERFRAYRFRQLRKQVGEFRTRPGMLKYPTSESQERTFLRSLEPTEWKDQDHYNVLGLGHLRHLATEEDIRQAYRQRCLKHHPDKRQGAGEVINPDGDYFACIVKAFEILGSSKRQSWDSVDPVFDNYVPSKEFGSADVFFQRYGMWFFLNSRWSNIQPVPFLGGMDMPRKAVEAFYEFWYEFDSWREYSYLDEEDKEKGHDRDERRWIEKQNKIERAKRRKEEMARIRQVVDNAYALDPRIAKFKQDDIRKKKEVKNAKKAIVQSKQREEERIKNEAEEKARREREEEEAAARERELANKKEKEAAKKAVKKERKAFRTFCKANDYFAEDEPTRIENLANSERVIEMLPPEELEALNTKLSNLSKDEQKNIFNLTLKALNEKVEEEKAKTTMSQIMTNGDSTKGKTTKDDWSSDNLNLLVKAVNLFPAGTNERWEVISNFLFQHANGGRRYTAKEILAKAKELKASDFSRNNLKKEVNDQAFVLFEKNLKGGPLPSESEASLRFDSLNGQNYTGIENLDPKRRSLDLIQNDINKNHATREKANVSCNEVGVGRQDLDTTIEVEDSVAMEAEGSTEVVKVPKKKNKKKKKKKNKKKKPSDETEENPTVEILDGVIRALRDSQASQEVDKEEVEKETEIDLNEIVSGVMGLRLYKCISDKSKIPPKGFDPTFLGVLNTSSPKVCETRFEMLDVLNSGLNSSNISETESHNVPEMESSIISLVSASSPPKCSNYEPLSVKTRSPSTPPDMAREGLTSRLSDYEDPIALYNSKQLLRKLNLSELVDITFAPTESIETDVSTTDYIETDDLEADGNEADNTELDINSDDNIESDNTEIETIESDNIEADNGDADNVEIEADDVDTANMATDNIEPAENVEASNRKLDGMDVERLETESVDSEHAEPANADCIAAESVEASNRELDGMDVECLETESDESEQAEPVNADSTAAESLEPVEPYCVDNVGGVIVENDCVQTEHSITGSSISISELTNNAMTFEPETKELSEVFGRILIAVDKGIKEYRQNTETPKPSPEWAARLDDEESDMAYIFARLQNSIEAKLQFCLRISSQPEALLVPELLKQTLISIEKGLIGVGPTDKKRKITDIFEGILDSIKSGMNIAKSEG